MVKIKLQLAVTDQKKKSTEAKKDIIYMNNRASTEQYRKRFTECNALAGFEIRGDSNR
ncbi:hypothetical protein M407DRAFT_168851 [Tulasnella calospora MUT 4182]|uniref:Uncharacterized protein n=1 Tax=Tulasnella calospora MUT 4182 TaxID=1051891 RepID=A0A0C3PSL2_9AGAM|nr:hypothetical protein M407DRAFT_168851 [Tulasnella calospora MUT 4182]